MAAAAAAVQRACTPQASVRQAQDGPCTSSRAPAPAALPRRQLASALAPRRTACRAACAAAAAADAEPAATAAEPAAKPKLVTPAWQTVLDLQQSGELVKTKVEAVNKAGVVVRVGGLQGFVPHRMLQPARLRELAAAAGQEVPEGELPTPPASGWASLKGQPLAVKVVQVNIPLKRVTCSEKAALLDELASAINPGDVVSGTVTGLHDWGAFVETDGANGLPRAEVILPLKELSWDWVPSSFAILAPGQAVRAKVLYVNRPPAKAKVVISLKRLSGDPLSETLDSVLPLEAGGKRGAAYAAPEDSVPASVPSGVEEVLQALAATPGVTLVELGRRVEEQRTVSQDLELWLTRDVVADGFNLVARAGRVVQEVHVTTTLDRSAMKEAVQRVMRDLA